MVLVERAAGNLPLSPGRRPARLAAALALAAAACSPGGPEVPAAAATAPPPARNVLLVTIDTLRADHLGCYGYDRPTSPALDEFAAGSVLFEHAMSTSSWTLPAMASLMTSSLPSRHGCVELQQRLPAALETLGERLASAGFVCGAVTSNVFLSPHYGFDQGFSSYENILRGKQRAVGRRGRLTSGAITSDVVTDKAIAWLAAHAGGPDAPRWFLWVHYFDPHGDYVPHRGISEAFGRARALDAYDAEIAFTDQCLGQLLGDVDARGLLATTAVIVAADHGEEFLDHGQTGHRHTLYQEVVHVPLLVRAPGAPPARCAMGVSLVDVFPTALDVLGLPAAPEAAGRSLVPALRGGALRPQPAVAELTVGEKLREAAVVANDGKLVVDLLTGRSQLYDVAADPGEAHDLAPQRPEDVQRLSSLLIANLDAAAAGRVDGGAPVADDGVMQELRALGYLGGDGGGEPGGSGH